MDKQTVPPNGSQGNSPVEKPFFEIALRLEEERHAISEDLKEIYADAKASGIDAAVLKLAIKKSMEDRSKRERRLRRELQAQELLIRLGEWTNTPLAEAAKRVADSVSRDEMSIEFL